MWDSSAFADMHSGAGFFNEPNQVDSPAQSKGKAGVRRHQSVLPVCVRQLRDCPEDEFKLFGMPTQILTIVGVLKEYEVQSTKATYEIEDHTGRISAIWWLESDSNTAPNLPLVKEGCYLRVYGSLRVQEGQKLLMVLRMFPVHNLNEITTHLLEVIHVRLEAEAQRKGSEFPARLQANNPGAELANSMSFMNNDADVQSNKSGLGLTPVQDKVYRILVPVTTASGLSRQSISQHFAPNQQREVNAALEFLINEGHVYSTINNDYFKVTDSM